jgi:putative ABC transport system permease protein
VRYADPQYFQTIGIPLKRGRVFTPADRLEQGNKAVISESMAAKFFPNEDPIGKRIRTGGDEPADEIVGIVGDARQNLSMPAEPTMYFPLFEGKFNFATLTVRAAGDPNLLSLPIQKEMRRMDPDLPAVTVKTMDDLIGGATSQNRFGLTLIALFAALAVALASIGLYGVLAYSIGQRTNEIGLRMALGATPGDITGLVVTQGLKPAAIGIVLGLAGGAAATRLIESVLFEVSATDPLVLISVVALLIAVTCAACLAPAWRAARIDPVVALRAE